jgi:hypothetical protein
MVMKKAQSDGVTFDELVQHLGMSAHVLSECLRGRREMAVEKVAMLEDKLKIKLPDKAKIKSKAK